jgi:hypothetical protein
MKNQEAKFILGTYRANGQDADDPMFADALSQAQRDPELQGWLRRQQAFDTAVAAKLHEVPPPGELREAILAGARASRPRPVWWMNRAWLGAAAAVLIVAAISVVTLRTRSGPSVSELAAFALQDLADAHDQHVGFPPEFAALQDQLGAARSTVAAAAAAGVDLDELRRKNCRSVRISGREVFEICFRRDGTWYHLYAARREDFASSPARAEPLFASRGEFAGTAWADAKHVYALVTHGSEAALRRLI